MTTYTEAREQAIALGATKEGIYRVGMGEAFSVHWFGADGKELAHYHYNLGLPLTVLNPPRTWHESFTAELDMTDTTPTPRTPGPWFIKDSHVLSIDHGKYYIVANVHNVNFTPAANKANARLIAAAPDLLAALRSIITANDAPPGATMGEAKVCEHYAAIARAAIAKATGTD